MIKILMTCLLVIYPLFVYAQVVKIDEKRFTIPEEKNVEQLKQEIADINAIQAVRQADIDELEARKQQILSVLKQAKSGSISVGDDIDLDTGVITPVVVTPSEEMVTVITP